MKNIHLLNHVYITSEEEIENGNCWVTNGKEVFKPLDHYSLEYANRYWEKIILTTDTELINDGVQAIDNEFLQWYIKHPDCEEVEVEEVKCKGQCWKFIESDYEDTCLSGCELKGEYKIIIPSSDMKNPKEEPAQETLEKVEEIYLSHKNNDFLYGHSEELQLAYKAGIIDGINWQQEQDSKELAMWKLAVERQEARCKALNGVISDLQERSYSEEEVETLLLDCRTENPIDVSKWFEEFKKK
jgi:hypothetical protein